LVPGEVLVGQCSLLGGEAVVGLEVGVFLAEVGEDGAALAEDKLAVDKEGNGAGGVEF
jgi:hypothetical protein